MKINFIITAFDKEIYLPTLLKIIRSYKRIEPEIVIAYNGSKADFPCTLRRPNMGHQHGDHDLTMTGYNHFKTINDGFRFIKIGIDSFLLDENYLIHFFDMLPVSSCCYAGNRWHSEESNSLATDIMFLDTRFGNPLNPPHGMTKDGDDYEQWMWQSMQRNNLHTMFIPYRTPVHPNNRLECEPLKWTMHHQLERNFDNMRKWGYGHLIA
jgi:hypothetical protein